MTRNDEMLEAARKYHKENPKVWVLFVKFTFELIKRGFKHYSASGIFMQIRCHTDTPDVNGRSAFKVNKNHDAFYSRGFMKQYPEHKGFFRTREQISKDEPPTNMPELKPRHFPCTCQPSNNPSL